MRIDAYAVADSGGRDFPRALSIQARRLRWSASPLIARAFGPEKGAVAAFVDDEVGKRVKLAVGFTVGEDPLDRAAISFESANNPSTLNEGT
jgi:hypothetical protein